jgi:hypothetical protein
MQGLIPFSPQITWNKSSFIALCYNLKIYKIHCQSLNHAYQQKISNLLLMINNSLQLHVVNFGLERKVAFRNREGLVQKAFSFFNMYLNDVHNTTPHG